MSGGVQEENRWKTLKIKTYPNSEKRSASVIGGKPRNKRENLKKTVPATKERCMQKMRERGIKKLGKRSVRSAGMGNGRGISRTARAGISVCGKEERRGPALDYALK